MAGRRKNILDVYREFKKNAPDYVYAFGDSEFFTFYMTDAHHVHEAIPDMRIEHDRYDFIRVHKALFFEVALKLRLKGLKSAMVGRRLNAQGAWDYFVSARSDDGDKETATE